MYSSGIALLLFLSYIWYFVTLLRLVIITPCLLHIVPYYYKNTAIDFIGYIFKGITNTSLIIRRRVQ
jgi:hypothetical protein